MSDNDRTGGRVHGKRVLITGAARGMGRCHALRLAEEGADLVLVDACSPMPRIEYPMATEAELADTAEAAVARGARVISAVADVRYLDELVAPVERAVDDFGGIDAVVANAGVLTAGRWHETMTEDWRTVLDVDLVGVWHAFRAALPHLVDHGGSLVAISSAAGVKGMPFTLPYTAAKHAITGLVRGLANETASSLVRVNSVHPTGVPTGITAPALHDLLGGERADLASIYTNAMPVERIEAIDVAHAVVYLVSDESRYVTGQQLIVDAGVTIR